MSTVRYTATGTSDDPIQALTDSVIEAFDSAVASVDRMWVATPTPVLSSGGGAPTGGGPPPGSESFTTILDYVTYAGLVIAVLSLIALGALVAVRMRRGAGLQNLGALGAVFAGVLLISAASAIVARILAPSASGDSSSTVGFLQDSLWFYVGGLAVLSVIIGGIRMAWEQRAQPGKDLLRSLVTLVVVSGAGLAILALAVTAADSFSVWVLSNATGCDVSGPSECFGPQVSAMLPLTARSPIGVVGVLILGVIALLMVYAQVAIMVVRGGLLVLFAGVLPLAASFTNTQMGRQWFGRIAGWTLAFVLYKPAAALIYAAAFQLVDTDVAPDDDGGLWSILTGMGVLTLALLALPALMRLVAPVARVVAGAGPVGVPVGEAAGVGGELATGAIRRNAGADAGGHVGPTSSGGSAVPTGARSAGDGATARAAPDADTTDGTGDVTAGGAAGRSEGTDAAGSPSPSDAPEATTDAARGIPASPTKIDRPVGRTDHETRER